MLPVAFFTFILLIRFSTKSGFIEENECLKKMVFHTVTYELSLCNGQFVCVFFVVDKIDKGH